MNQGNAQILRSFSWIWNQLCRIGLSISGHAAGVGHMLRGHNVEWECDVLPWIGYFGSITCRKCPDCDGGDLLLWSRNSLLIQTLGMWLCKALGHGAREHPKIWDGTRSSDGEMNFPEHLDKWQCSRCLVDL